MPDPQQVLRSVKIQHQISPKFRLSEKTLEFLGKKPSGCLAISVREWLRMPRVYAFRAALGTWETGSTEVTGISELPSE